MKKITLFLTAMITGILLFTPPLNFNSLMAQNAILLEPDSAEKSFDVRSEIKNTGTGGMKYNYQGYMNTLHVMVWDGQNQGFGWHLQGSMAANDPNYLPNAPITGHQSIYLDDEIIDPDIVIGDVDSDTLAHIVYETDNQIYYEVWKYYGQYNDWDIYQIPTRLSDDGANCSSPNIDIYHRDSIPDSIAVVWNRSQESIMGVTGRIDGNYNTPHIIYEADFEVGKPDVAISWVDLPGFSSEYRLTVCFHDGNEDEKTLMAIGYLYDKFTINNIEFVDNLLHKSTNEKIFGSPRIAANRRFNCHDTSTYPYEVVMVEEKNDTILNDSVWYVHGFNRYNNDSLYKNYYHDTLNFHSYKSQINNNTYDAWKYQTQEPVVSFLEDLKVAWGYKSPATGSFEIVERLLDAKTGEVLETWNGTPYSYSLVNNPEYVRDQLHPCIATRFNYVNDIFIGWFDEYTAYPDYKVRHTNTEIFNNEKEVEQMWVYPNPTQNILTIDLPDKKGETKMNLYSLKGRKVLSKVFSSSHKSNDISDLADGVYIIEIKTSNDIKRKKIVKTQ